MISTYLDEHVGRRKLVIIGNRIREQVWERVRMTRRWPERIGAVRSMVPSCSASDTRYKYLFTMGGHCKKPTTLSVLV